MERADGSVAHYCCCQLEHSTDARVAVDQPVSYELTILLTLVTN